MVVNINSILMVLCYVPSHFFLANFLFKKIGVNGTLIIGVILNCVCLWFRAFIAVNVYISMAGGFFYGIAQPLILNANAEFAANWFDTGEVIYNIKNMMT